VLAEHFVREFAARSVRPIDGIAPEALDALERHRWSGNVRELQNVLRVATLRAGRQVRLEHLPPAIVSPARPVVPSDPDPSRFELRIPWPQDESGRLDLKKLTHDVRETLERRILTRLIRDLRMNKSQMARYLELDYKVLLAKLKALGLDDDSGGSNG
jgi:DNA-binding NtrC family response regulator